MSNIRIVLNEKGLIEQLNKLDKREHFGDENSFWLEFKSRPDEITFEDGQLSFSFSSDELPTIFIDMPIEELLEQFERFGIAEEMSEYLFKSSLRTQKIIKIMNDLKKEREEETQKRIEQYKKEEESKKHKKK
jgi:hypothetical protein